MVYNLKHNGIIDHSTENFLCWRLTGQLKLLEEVPDEVVNDFETKRIHIGCNECQLVRWPKCSKCQKRYQKLNGNFNVGSTEQSVTFVEKSQIAIGLDDIYTMTNFRKIKKTMAYHKNPGVRAANNKLKVKPAANYLLFIEN